MKGRDLYIGKNKDKIMVVLYSFKTHDVGDKPQKVKIVANNDEKSRNYIHRNFCPVRLVTEYFRIRGPYDSYQENLFIFRDKSPVTADQARKVLRYALDKIGIESNLYDMHSLRIGRASDLIKYNYTIDEVKRLGRWKSNVVYKYIRS